MKGHPLAIERGKEEMSYTFGPCFLFPYNTSVCVCRLEINQERANNLLSLADRNITKKTMRFLFSPFFSFFLPNALLLARRIKMQFRGSRILTFFSNVPKEKRV